jgi:uncharacterized protein
MRQVLFMLILISVASASDSRPKVRAITAFIDIDSKSYPAQLESTVKFLNAARESYVKAGFEVETIRIATQPFPQYTRGLSRDAALALLRNIDALSEKLAFSPSIGPAMLLDSDDTSSVDLLADVLSQPSRLNASLVTASEEGIHWTALHQAARLIKSISQRSPHGQGNFNFAAIAMLKPYGPFFPGAYHLGGGHSFSVGLESANVVADVFAQNRDPRTAEKALATALSRYTQEAETLAAQIAAGNKGWTYNGIDPTPAPLGEVSIGRAIESFTGSPFGSSGTMTAAAIITRAVQSVPVKRVGYSGLMIPVMEDAVLSRRWAQGTYTTDSLLAYSAVCAGGLDTVPLPGDISEERVAQILSDVTTLAYKWKKPLAARLLPVPGKKAGELTEFNDPRMANTTIHP